MSFTYDPTGISINLYSAKIEREREKGGKNRERGMEKDRKRKRERKKRERGMENGRERDGER